MATVQIKTEDSIAVYSNSQAIKDRVFDELIKYYKKHEAFSGESVMQRDAPQIEAAELLAHIADNVICFDAEYF